MTDISHIFFDLDGTLYPKDNGIWAAISQRMESYMADVLGIPAADIPALRQHYLKTYGTTLRGLQTNYSLDSEAYLAHVHDIPLAELVQPDLRLRQILLALPQRKIIFTNADRNHAGRVLTALGIADLMDDILDVWALNYENKPHPVVYQQALALAGNPSPHACLLAEDTLQNIPPARALGFSTVLVGASTPHPEADYTIASIHDLLDLPCFS